MDTDPLVTLALEVLYPPAREELERRCEGWKDHRIAFLARDTPLGPEDVEDARQQGAFWVEEAIRSYKVAEMYQPGACHIRTWLERVVTHRFTDFLKAWRRKERHLDRSRSAVEALDSAGNPPAHCPGGSASGRGVSETELAARRHEWEDRLAKALGELDPQVRRVWEVMADGKTLPEVGEALGVSKDAAKRLWWKLRDHLRARLGEVPD
jgi:RNA polymerase sigma factor (sigma-70 family)